MIHLVWPSLPSGRAPGYSHEDGKINIRSALSSGPLLVTNTMGVTGNLVLD